MNNYPQPSAPPLEPELQFQYITYPHYVANSQYIHQIPNHMHSYYNTNYNNNIKVKSEENNINCFTCIATCVALVCCCFVAEETTV